LGMVMPLTSVVLKCFKVKLWADDLIGPLAFGLAALGMIAGSLLTQKACPPTSLAATRKTVARGEGDGVEPTQDMDKG
jgi:hypothetical protein